MSNDRKVQPYPSALALVMARTQQRLADKYDDQDLARHAEALRQRAEKAIKDGKAELPKLN